jgi:UDP-N-acetyl-D-mannosaminuronate dehydrogenase
MAQSGAQVKAFEPNKPDAQFDGFETVPTLSEALREAEIIVILVGNREFKQLVPREVAAQTRARIVVDMRGILEREAWESAGFRLFTLGVGSVAND